LVRYQNGLERPGRTDVVAAWRRARRLSQAGGVVFSPREDALVGDDLAARDAAYMILADILAGGTAVALTTRVGLAGGEQLLALARRFPSLISVRIGIFGGPPDEERRWEDGLPTRADRLELVAALVKTGAHIEVEVGPIIPFVNDNEVAWKALLRAIARAGARTVVPRFLAGSPELVSQVEKEIAPSAGRMVLGWLSRGVEEPWFRASRGSRRGPLSHVPSSDIVRALPLQARQPRLRRLTELAAAANLTVRTCACFDGGRAHVCHALQARPQVVRQLDLQLEFLGAMRA